MLKKTLLALLGLNLLIPAAGALPGEKRTRMEQILKHHAFFPASNFRQSPGEIGPMLNSRALTENRELFLEAYYDAHLDEAETIQYEQVYVVNSTAEENCSFVFELKTHYHAVMSDLPFAEIRRQCMDGAAVDFHIKDSKAIKALELGYGTSSPVIADFKAAKRVRTANQYFYLYYDENTDQLVRRAIQGDPIPFAVYKGDKFTYIASPNHVMIVKPNFPFSQAYANWAKDEQLFKQIQADQQKQKPYEL